MVRFFAVAGAVSAFLGVALGAFAAHGLKSKLSPELLGAFEIGVRYQMWHALALFVAAWAQAQWPGASFGVTGWLFFIGIVVFSGSLYALALSGRKLWGAVTPLGGLCFLVGWATLAWEILRRS